MTCGNNAGFISMQYISPVLLDPTVNEKTASKKKIKNSKAVKTR